MTPVQMLVPEPVQIAVQAPDLISRVSVQLFPSEYAKTAFIHQY
jgi:hypothetical protein